MLRNASTRMLKYMKAFQVHFGPTRVLSKNSSLSLLMSFLFGFSDLKNILLFLETDLFWYESFSSTYSFLLMSYRKIKVVILKRSYKSLSNYCFRILITHVISRRICQVLQLLVIL